MEPPFRIFVTHRSNLPGLLCDAELQVLRDLTDQPAARLQIGVSAGDEERVVEPARRPQLEIEARSDFPLERRGFAWVMKAFRVDLNADRSAFQSGSGRVKRYETNQLWLWPRVGTPSDSTSLRSPPQGDGSFLEPLGTGPIIMLLIEPSDLDSNPLVHQEVWRHLAIRFVADVAVAAMPKVAFYEPFSRVHLIASTFAGW